jgi:hypothetical protein
MKNTFYILLVIHVILVLAIGIWLLAMGRFETKVIPRGFISLSWLTLILSLGMMQINLMQHRDDSDVYLLSPYKYGAKTLVFLILIAIAIKNYRKPKVSQREWQAMIALMAIDLIITGVWV